MDDAPFGYKKLRVWQLARELVIEVHSMTMHKLPKFELYEEGSQIRRSIKSVRSNIVEGYGRRRYKQEYLRFLDFAYASLLETIDHLETLHETGSLADDELFSTLDDRLNQLSKSLFSFIRSVEQFHDTSRA
ncbi:four helix bundle protein [Luteolibacter marinus]|uniref:four helix bundle protein n=1 Tax=Luteolibacter marinus TaxID=2776705 RepID=UPI001866E0D5|nr:four helix bundle protein [Luteolibacter marinus]